MSTTDRNPPAPGRVRKPNRRCGPARVTQRGTSTAYPHPARAGLTRRQDRYAGTEARGQ